MNYTYRVGYKVKYEDGSYEIKWGYVHARSLHEAWVKGRAKFGDVRYVE